MPTPGIKVEGVWKKFRRGDVHDSLRDLVPALARRLVGRRRPADVLAAREFWALSDVSFDVEPGEALGVIGHNGAGKSTLLKLINQIIRPTRGYTEVRGRTGSLIEISAGFHPDLTGRQNVFLQGAIIGMSTAEISRKFDQIVEFSGIEKFIDTPVKRYSSGMNARLGFAIAAHLDTEVLIIDEVLAVGDLAFQERAFGRIKEMSSSGIPVVLVTHQLERMTTLCTKAILLDGGRIVREGTPEECVETYATAVFESGDRGAHLPFRLTAVEVVSPSPVPSGERVHLLVRGELDRGAPPIYDLHLRVRSARTGKVVFSTLGVNCGVGDLPPGEFEIEVELQLNVGQGIFSVETAVHDSSRRQDVAVGPHAHLRVSQSTAFNGSVQMNPVMRVVGERTPRLVIAADS
ncbi:MAG TPA: ABC transporter ATP-binding protein [Gemmatimonadaceae bacterium]|nr:ABC transporter ATP-binding protein [Gemmatimonadaceae bacterium]